MKDVISFAMFVIALICFAGLDMSPNPYMLGIIGLLCMVISMLLFEREKGENNDQI